MKDCGPESMIGVLGPIEIAEFRDYLRPAELEASLPKGLGGTPVNLLCRELYDAVVALQCSRLIGTS